MTFWIGWALTLLAVSFLVLDSGMKLAMTAPSIKATAGLGYPQSAVRPIGVTLAVCTLLYVIPRTSVFGAILLTGYLGGAVASNIRADSGRIASAFPILFAVIVWAGIALRYPALEAVLLSL